MSKFSQYFMSVYTKEEQETKRHKSLVWFASPQEPGTEQKMGGGSGTVRGSTTEGIR